MELDPERLGLTQPTQCLHERALIRADAGHHGQLVGRRTALVEVGHGRLIHLCGDIRGQYNHYI